MTSNRLEPSADAGPDTAAPQRPSATDLVAGIVTDAQTLLRQQVVMLRAEMREDMRRTKEAAKYMGIGVTLAAVGGLFLLVGAVALLNWLVPALPQWACWAIVGGVLLVGGAIAVYAGKRIFDSFNPLPDKTAHALEEEYLVANDESPELIEQQMTQTREALAEKVATLEQQVIGTLHSATEAVHETVESVKSAVQETVSSVRDTVTGVKDTVTESVSSVSEGVMQTLDVRAQVNANPWLMVGGAAAAGFFTGLFVFPRSGTGLFTRPVFERASFTPAVEPAAGPTRRIAPEREAPREPGWTDELVERAGREAKKLGEQALMAVVAAAQKNINEGLPKLIDRFLKVPERTAAECGTRRSQFEYPG